jgi:hypothetical protein
MNALNLLEPEKVNAALTQLRSIDDPTNWVLLGYGEGKNDVLYMGQGTGGLEEFREQMDQNRILFGIVELQVQGDEYNPVKYVLVAWIGNKVPSGLARARAAGHRAELIQAVKEYISISSEFQTSKKDDINYDNIAQSLTRMRPTYHTTTQPSTERKQMSGGTSKGTSKLQIVDQERVEAGLREVYEGRADWCILSYVKDSKDEVEILETGSGGIEALQSRFPTDRIFFVMVSIHLTTTDKGTITKFVLLTLVGPQVKPLQKARSGGQREEISQFILTVMPLHAHYQPGSARDLTLEQVQKVVPRA